MKVSFFFCRFEALANAKQLSIKQLDKFAFTFWKYYTLKGEMECPFPDYLVKYYKGEFDPME